MGIYRLALIAFLFIAGCAPAHYYKSGFIHDPSLDRFGASLAREGGSVVVRSYVRSEIPLRTEYIYENLDITMPDGVELNKKYPAGSRGFVLWYANGGQAGQIETRKARGTIAVRSLTADKVLLECDLEFYGFTMKGHYMNPPASIKRKGILSAKRGYVLYP